MSDNESMRAWTCFACANSFFGSVDGREAVCPVCNTQQRDSKWYTPPNADDE